MSAAQKPFVLAEPYASACSALGFVPAGSYMLCENGHKAFEQIEDHPFPADVIDSRMWVDAGSGKPPQGKAVCPICGSPKFQLRVNL